MWYLVKIVPAGGGCGCGGCLFGFLFLIVLFQGCGKWLQESGLGWVVCEGLAYAFVFAVVWGIAYGVTAAILYVLKKDLKKTTYVFVISYIVAVIIASCYVMIPTEITGKVSFSDGTPVKKGEVCVGPRNLSYLASPISSINNDGTFHHIQGGCNPDWFQVVIVKVNGEPLRFASTNTDTMPVEIKWRSKNVLNLVVEGTP